MCQIPIESGFSGGLVGGKDSCYPQAMRLPVLRKTLTLVERQYCIGTQYSTVTTVTEQRYWTMFDFCHRVS